MTWQDFRKNSMKRLNYILKDKRALVEKYYPGKFTEDDWKEESPSTALEIATEASIGKFNAEKNAFDGKRAGYAEQAKRQQESYANSVTSSVSALKQSFPDVDADSLTQVKGLLDGGPAKIVEFLFNADGSAKADSAERLMMALVGKETIMDLSEVAANVREGQVNEQLLTRGADSPKPTKQGVAPGPQITDNEKAELNRLQKLKESQIQQNNVFS